MAEASKGSIRALGKNGEVREDVVACRAAISPGRVDWSGENPGIYLKQTSDGPYVSLVSLFRVVTSPYGRGHALVLLDAPEHAGSRPEALNVCVTDNEALARWLVREFVAYFPSFRASPALDALDYRPLTDIATSGDARTTHIETVRGEGVEARLAWRELGEPFMVAAPAKRAPTGKHELFSLFVPAKRASAVVNGHALKGRLFPCDFWGRRGTTAYLAFSETWVRAPVDG